MNKLSKIWHKLWGRNDRDIHLIERVVEIERAVHNMGAWYLLNSNSPSISMLESKVSAINKNLEQLMWEYKDLMADETFTETIKE